MAVQRYQLIREVGRGANGIVNAEFDTDSQLTVARKYLANSALPNAELKREFRQLANASHPNLVKLYALESNDEGTSFTMELVNGPNIVDYALSNPEQIRGLFEQTLSACEYLDAHNFVHRDLKPTNILVTNGRVVILDFGLATLAGKTHEGLFTGTPRYSAPEQLLGQPTTSKSDLFSVGVIFAEILGEAEYDWVRRWRTNAISTKLSVANVVLDSVNALLIMDESDRASAGEILHDLGVRAANARQATFIGRSHELELVTDEVGVFTIVGESGIGKSRFLEEAAQLCRERGQTILSGRCRNWEHIGFQAIDEVVEQLLSLNLSPSLTEIEKCALAEAFSIVKEGNESRSLDTQLKREAVSSGLHKLLVEANSKTPLVVVIDDFQWVDKDSFSVIQFLLASRLFEDIRLLIGCRAEDQIAIKELTGPVNVVTLEGLTEAEAALLLRPRGNLTSGELSQLNSECLGSPYFLTEAFRLIGAEHYVLGAGQEGIMQSKLDRLSPELKPLVDLICVSGAPVDEKFVQSVFGSSSPHYALLSLEKESWIRPIRKHESLTYEPFHSKVREYVVQELGVRSVPLHKKIAHTISRVKPKNYEGLTFHYEGAGEFDLAGEFAMKAGITAEQRLAFDSADGFYEKAAALKKFDDESGNELKLRHAQVKYNLGDCYDSAILASEAADCVYLARNDQILLIANAWFSAGYLEKGLEHLRDLVTVRKLSEPGRWTLWLKLLMQIVRLRLIALKNHSGQVPEKETWLADVYWSLGKLNMMSTKHGTYFQLLALQQYLEQNEIRKSAMGLAVFSNVLRHIGIFSDYADQCMAKAQMIGERYEDPQVLATCKLWQAHSELNNENWLTSAELTLEAISDMESENQGLTWECTTGKNFLLMSLERLGELDLMMSKTETFLQQAKIRGDYYAQTIFGLFDAFWNISKKSLVETTEQLSKISNGWSTQGYTIQDFYIERVKIYALLYHDEIQAAYEVLSETWSNIASSDVLDVTSSELDALFMYGLVLLHVRRADNGDMPSSWHFVNKRLAKSKLSEAQAYLALLNGSYASQLGLTGKATDEFQRALRIFEANDSGVAVQYSRYALGQPIPDNLFLPQKWLQTLIPL